MDLFWEQIEPSAGGQREASTHGGRENLRKAAAFLSRLRAVLPSEVLSVFGPN